MASETPPVDRGIGGDKHRCRAAQWGRGRQWFGRFGQGDLGLQGLCCLSVDQVDLVLLGDGIFSRFRGPTATGSQEQTGDCQQEQKC